jgi:glyoxylase-like metal-dependent hydrolase (beta-lactamase superfamily II)
MEIVTKKNRYLIRKLLSGRSNVFLVTNGNNHVIIDSGIAWMRKKLNSRLKAWGITHIDYLILTHCHFDHAGNAAWIKENFGAKAVVHKSEVAMLESGINQELPDGLTALTRPVVRFLKHYFHPSAHFNPCKADILTDDLYDFKNEGLNVYIIHTPGHSEGSQTIVVDDEIALSGDSMFGIFPGSILPPFGNNLSLLVSSWEKQLKTGCTMFFPSHGFANSRKLVEKEYGNYHSQLQKIR